MQHCVFYALLMLSIYYYFVPSMGAKCCDEYVLVSVFLSGSITRKPHGRTLPIFCAMLPLAMAWSSFNGIVIYYIFPVLWMMSCFHTNGPMARVFLSHNRT